MSETSVVIDYTNWRGERRTRRIKPIAGSLRFEENQWHKPAQWLIEAIDLEKGGDLDMHKTFAISNIHSWKPEEP